jgi:hypothetical protein
MVTNRQFKQFVDAGGYRKAEYWKQPFVRSGLTLSFAQALEEFRDETGRPGPANWHFGTYPDGAEDMPVGGVSWYEAMAYAEFAGKGLPTGTVVRSSRHHGPQQAFHLEQLWRPRPAKAVRVGMAPYGTFDMAGNLKEWTMNPAGVGYLLGGAWNEDNYVFGVFTRGGHFPRGPFGFRCVRRLTPSPRRRSGLSRRGQPRIRRAGRRSDVPEIPDLHAYEKSDLIPKSSVNSRRPTGADRDFDLR